MSVGRRLVQTVYPVPDPAARERMNGSPKRPEECERRLSGMEGRKDRQIEEKDLHRQGRERCGEWRGGGLQDDDGVIDGVTSERGSSSNKNQLYHRISHCHLTQTWRRASSPWREGGECAGGGNHPHPSRVWRGERRDIHGAKTSGFFPGE